MLVTLVLSCVPFAVHSKAGASGAPEASCDHSHAEAAMLLQKNILSFYKSRQTIAVFHKDSSELRDFCKTAVHYSVYSR